MDSVVRISGKRKKDSMTNYAVRRRFEYQALYMWIRIVITPRRYADV